MMLHLPCRYQWVFPLHQPFIRTEYFIVSLRSNTIFKPEVEITVNIVQNERYCSIIKHDHVVGVFWRKCWHRGAKDSRPTVKQYESLEPTYYLHILFMDDPIMERLKSMHTSPHDLVSLLILLDASLWLNRAPTEYHEASRSQEASKSVLGRTSVVC